MARVCEAKFEQHIDIEAALAFLNEQYADCYRFVFDPRPFHTFFSGPRQNCSPKWKAQN
ncbi:MAG: hypothetical protein M5U34_31240 [Chloroflexi bacterium]|nr:hypothetical protein [Chloroflexota bacterium]